MSAPNTVSASTMDQKPREPSMEEILASIRRIIADDQSLPGRAAGPSLAAEIAPSASAPDESVALHPSAVRIADLPIAPEPPKQEETMVASDPISAPAFASPPPVTTEHTRDPVRRHGTVAAPQFAMPDGPASDGDSAEEPARVETRQAEEDATAAAWHEDARQMSTTPRMEDSDMTHEPERDAQLYATPLAQEPTRERERESEPQDQSLLFSAATDTSIQSAFNMLAATRLADNSDELKAMVREMIRPLLRTWLDDNLPTMVERMVRTEIERVARGGR